MGRCKGTHPHLHRAPTAFVHVIDAIFVNFLRHHSSQYGTTTRLRSLLSFFVLFNFDTRAMSLRVSDTLNADMATEVSEEKYKLLKRRLREMTEVRSHSTFFFLPFLIFYYVYFFFSFIS